MSHYFKRESEHQRQGHEEGSSPHTVVPIFNSKKRRIKQALYSNPSSSQANNFQSSFSNNTTQYGGTRPEIATKTTSQQNVATTLTAFDSSIRSKAKLPTHGFNNNSHESTRQSQRPMQIKSDSKSQANTGPKVIPCLPKPRPQFGVGGISLKSVNTNHQGNDHIRTNCGTINKTLKSRENNATRGQERGTMKTKVDNSAKFYTASIQTIMDWEKFRDKTTAVFEVYGVLESAVSTNATGNAKTFILKDNTSNVRCTFWEMDRSLPRLTRGRNYRCVGSLDRKTKTLNCVIVRPANLVEVRSAGTNTACSEVAMQSYIATFKED